MSVLKGTCRPRPPLKQEMEAPAKKRRANNNLELTNLQNDA